MRYLSVCSGIEAASVAWGRLPDWSPVAFAETDKFCSRVLAHRFPSTPNLGDIYGIRKTPGLVGAIQRAGVGNSQGLLVGGTPCQGFSIAGLRGGVADPRGALTVEFVRVAAVLKPRWIVWENVPGVLSIDGGRTFHNFLTALADVGYGASYRVLDAKWFGVAQTRRRVFVVACLGEWGGWAGASAVLQECESVRGSVETGGKKRKAKGDAKGVGGSVDGGGGGGGGGLIPELTKTLRAGGGTKEKGHGATTAIWDAALIPEYAHTLRSGPPSGGAAHGKLNGSDAVTLIPEYARTINAGGGAGQRRFDATTETLIAETGRGWRVRQLTVVECARLQGFSDDWTAVPDAKGRPPADGPQYKAYGNSMAVPVIVWIGRRLAAVDGLMELGVKTGQKPWWMGCGV